MQRWVIRRRNPIKHHVRPDIVRVWCIPDGSKYGKFLPLDQRVIDFLIKTDIQRRFQKIDKKRWANLIQRELDAAEQLRVDKLHDQWEENKRRIRPALKYAINKGERGVAVDPDSLKC